MKKVRSFLLIVFSAVLYAVPFLCSASMWWLVFLFPVPLLYAASRDNFGFAYGFLWGVVTFLLHGIGGISVVAHMAHERWLLGMFMGLGIVLYQAVCIGFVFWLFQQWIRFFVVQAELSKLCVNTLMVAFVIFWIDRGSLCIFGVVEGYPLMHPLFVLMGYPPLLFLLPFIGKQLLTMVFLCFPASVAGFLLVKNRVACAGVMFALIPWFFAVWLYSIQTVTPEQSWVKGIVAFPHMTLCKSLYPVSMIKSVAQQMRVVLEQYPHAQCIVMPESAFDSEILLTVPDLLKLWGDQYIGKPIHMIFGASRVHDDKYYNCGYWLYNGVLQECFDKRHTMMLSERIPEWLDCAIVRSMYRSNGCCEVVCGVKLRSAIAIDGTLFMPYLCSELFFNEYPHDLSAEALAEEGLHNNQPILVLVNDSVFGESYYSRYIQNLLVFLARFKAMMWQRDIVYVSYAHTLFVGKQGKISQLQQ